MNIKKFPFSAILGQENMKLALILNLIDPEIGGVLLTGQQGTGKSTAVRSLVDIMPNISVREKCQFNCSIENNGDFLCTSCRLGEKTIIEKPTPLINLPLGATAEMVLGSINVETVIKEGKKEIEPGLLAKAHRGILYVDEINLLPDHLVDILLDASASKVNTIEREGISLSHPSNFVLVGSMNPEEGELRPQISDRLGLEVKIKSTLDSRLRSEITRRVISFRDDPETFCKKYEEPQKELKEKILSAKKLIKHVSIPERIYELVAQLVIKFGLKSQRADLTLVRCARTLAAFKGKDRVTKDHVKRSMELVIEHRLEGNGEEITSEYMGESFEEIWHKLEKDIDFENPKSEVEPKNPEQYDSNTFKASKKVFKKFKETPLNKENYDLPEVDGAQRYNKRQKNRFSNANLDEELNIGYKAGKNGKFKRFKRDESIVTTYSMNNEEDIKLDINPLLNFIKRGRKITTYAGRGNRVKILSKSTGTHIYSVPPERSTHKVSFLDSIKAHYLHGGNSARSLELERVDRNFSQIEIPKLAINLRPSDLREKVYELHAPLSVYFIVDASASMRRTLEQVTKIIKSVHAAGYSKKDKISIISFQGRYVDILQRPSVSLSIGINKLKGLEATSYTPLASALDKVLKMINQEQIKGISVPIIIIMSDLGANVSKKNPDLNAQTNEEFMQIAEELNDYAEKISKRDVNLLLMKPKKSFATRFLGVHPLSAQLIEKNFLQHGAKLFTFDAYDPDLTITRLKDILK